MTAKKKLLTVILMFVFLFTTLLSVGIMCSADTNRTTDGANMPGTNIPDTNIGGATGGLDTADGSLVPDGSDMLTNPIAGTDNDPVTNQPQNTTTPITTPATTDADAGGSMGMGWIGIIITVAVIAAIVIAVLALMPKKK